LRHGHGIHFHGEIVGPLGHECLEGQLPFSADQIVELNFQSAVQDMTFVQDKEDLQPIQILVSRPYRVDHHVFQAG
jgi:hypothetical protein